MKTYIVNNKPFLARVVILLALIVGLIVFFRPDLTPWLDAGWTLLKTIILPVLIATGIGYLLHAAFNFKVNR